MVDARFPAYVALMGLLIVIPGPDMLMVTRTVLRSGRPDSSWPWARAPVHPPP